MSSLPDQWETHAPHIAPPQRALAMDAHAQAMHNAVSSSSIAGLCQNQEVVRAMDHNFTHVLDEDWVANNQHHTGRCWIHAALNVLRASWTQDFKKFELSQNYLAFYDKLERANTFLAQIRATAHLPTTDRTVQLLLGSELLEDGGQWTMVTQLIQKYGLVPKWIMGGTYSDKNTSELNGVLQALLRRGAAKLREKVRRKECPQALISDLLAHVHRVLCVHYGTPPYRFHLRWKDDNNRLHDLGHTTPHEFAKRLLARPLDEYTVLTHDPRPANPPNQWYAVPGLTSVAQSAPFHYLSVDLPAMKRAARRTLVELGEPVWFTCDVGKQFDSERGLMARDLYRAHTLYDLERPLTHGFSKAQRLMYGASAPTHAMVFTGLDAVDGRVRKWRVENSWGDESGDDGFLAMQDDWFDDYVFQIVVPTSTIPPEILAQARAHEITELPLWDPMGSVAR